MTSPFGARAVAGAALDATGAPCCRSGRGFFRGFRLGFQGFQPLGHVTDPIGHHPLVPGWVVAAEHLQAGFGLGVRVAGRRPLACLPIRIGLLDEVVNANEGVIGAIGTHPTQAKAKPHDEVAQQFPETIHRGTGYRRI